MSYPGPSLSHKSSLDAKHTHSEEITWLSAITWYLASDPSRFLPVVPPKHSVRFLSIRTYPDFPPLPFFRVPTSPEWKIPPWPLVSLLIPSNGNGIITYSNQIALIANWQAEFRCCRNWKRPPVGHQQLLLARVDKYNEMSSWLFSGDRVAAL